MPPPLYSSAASDVYKRQPPVGENTSRAFFDLSSVNCRSGLALFRLNEYNIFGVVFASIVIMRCRK